MNMKNIEINKYIHISISIYMSLRKSLIASPPHKKVIFFLISLSLPLNSFIHTITIQIISDYFKFGLI